MGDVNKEPKWKSSASGSPGYIHDYNICRSDKLVFVTSCKLLMFFLCVKTAWTMLSLLVTTIIKGCFSRHFQWLYHS